MATKLLVKDILAAIDLNAKNVWRELSDDERKQVSFWLLNRYASSVKGSREKTELALFKTNEYYNKNWNVLGGTKHNNLQWQLLCVSGNTGKIEYHEWIGLKQKNNPNNKEIKLLQKLYPNMKLDEIELLANISTKKEIKQLVEDHGINE
ncbi:uncharacterized protein METZ01_LOCUS114404 [marine metagenome]|uniref:Uncharacterized protein n=1 Tax=marine metagenome TaxID=408172 RepID=A0A381XAB4_9ZZZZ